MNPINFVKPYIGMDVEFFFKGENDNVVGAEKIIKKASNQSSGYGEITVDGVAAELNPAPSYCRELLRTNIQRVLQKISTNKVSFDSSISISREEFNSLSPDSKIFGCKPSYDVYNDGKPTVIKIKGSDTLQRTAGGHIHLGIEKFKIVINTKEMVEECKKCVLDCKRISTIFAKEGLDIQSYFNIHDFKDNKFSDKLRNKNHPFHKKVYKKSGKKYNIDYYDEDIKIESSSVCTALQHPELLIPLLDLFCGIPSILLDRSNGALLRRKLYGKAGDYRLTPYGIEYRTLSNFWIKSYTLMSFFTGMARHALLLLASYYEGKNNIYDILNKINKKDIQKAINNNDFVIAKDIFLSIEEDILTSVPTNLPEENFPLTRDTIIAFKYLVINGISRFFKDDIVKEWENNHCGFESFCNRITDIDQDKVNETFKKFNGDISSLF